MKTNQLNPKDMRAMQLLQSTTYQAEDECFLANWCS